MSEASVFYLKRSIKMLESRVSANTNEIKLYKQIN